MALTSVAEFAGQDELVAWRVDSDGLPGLFSKTLQVPVGAVAWVRYDDGRELLAAESTEVTGQFTVVLHKLRDVGLAFQVAELTTADDHAVTAGIDLVARLPSTKIDLHQLRTTLLAGTKKRVTLDHIRAHLLPGVRVALAAFVGARTSDELMCDDPRAALTACVLAELEGPAFNAGLEVLEVRYPSFYCEAFERMREQRAQARLQAEEIEHKEHLHQLKAKLEREHEIAQAEVAEVARGLRHQGVMQELALKDDLERQRIGKELNRFNELQQNMGNDEMKALIMLLEDDRLKAQLIQELIRRDMTAEQLAAVQTEELERKVEERLAALSGHMAAVAGERGRRSATDGMRCHRALVVAGKQILGFDPLSASRAPSEVYDFAKGGLGFVRSVRTMVTREGTSILAGAQNGVYVVAADQPESKRELRFATEPSGRGGINSVAYFSGYIYATHSEMGLVRWGVHGVHGAETLFADVTAQNDSTRGVCVSVDGQLFFASGSNLYRHQLLHPERDLTCYEGTGDAVTTFVNTRHELFAGTRDGRVLRWSVDDAGAPRELNMRKAEPIYMLRIAELDGAPHLLVGAKEHGLTAVTLEDGRMCDYRAPEQIRWVDGATDVVVGVSRRGYKLYVWEAHQLAEPVAELHTAERVQDVWLLKEPMGGVV